MIHSSTFGVNKDTLGCYETAVSSLHIWEATDSLKKIYCIMRFLFSWGCGLFNIFKKKDGLTSISFVNKSANLLSQLLC